VTRKYYNTRSRIFLLYLHLNVSDMLVLVFNALVRGTWVLTFSWNGGDGLCRGVKFVETVAFSISSNVMVCVAADRLYSVKRPFKAHSLKRVRGMLVVAWTAAIVLSLTQLFSWEVGALALW